MVANTFETHKFNGNLYLNEHYWGSSKFPPKQHETKTNLLPLSSLLATVSNSGKFSQFNMRDD